MTDRPPGRSDADGPKDLFERTKKLYRITLGALAEKYDAIREGDYPTVTAFKKDLALLRELQGVLIKETQKYDETLAGDEGHDGPIDLEAMRAKISSRIDRIRNAGRAGRLPGESDGQ